ncbi:MAG: PD-(D/E)XK nuclease family protein [Candidatus Andersenbacteria bacterium]
MSDYYRPKRTRGVFDPKSSRPHKLSRSKIDLFIDCPRCFYLDVRRGVARPPGFPFNLNSAVDALLKKEFDIHRAKQSKHPLMSEYGVDAVPFAHTELNEWRENFVGVQFHHQPTNLLVTGAVDDVWKNPHGQLIVVDYKATSKTTPITLDAPWQGGYKRQMEVYQWLLRQKGFAVSDTGYFVYCNGRRDRAAFDKKLEFTVQLIPYTGKTDWIEPILQKIKDSLMSAELPAAGRECDYCAYTATRAQSEPAHTSAKTAKAPRKAVAIKKGGPQPLFE